MWVIMMQYTDANMQAYFQSLPFKVRAILMRSNIEISTLGELMMVGEHLKNELPTDEQEPIK